MPSLPSPIIVVRFGITALFLWFGTQQLFDPNAWTIFLPEWTGYFPIPAEILVRTNGLIEIVLALLLGVGVFTRVSAFLLGVHLAGIAASVGGATGVRDGVLALCTLALALGAPDAYTLDAQEKSH